MIESPRQVAYHPSMQAGKAIWKRFGLGIASFFRRWTAEDAVVWSFVLVVLVPILYVAAGATGQGRYPETWLAIGCVCGVSILLDILALWKAFKSLRQVHWLKTAAYCLCSCFLAAVSLAMLWLLLIGAAIVQQGHP